MPANPMPMCLLWSASAVLPCGGDLGWSSSREIEIFLSPWRNPQTLMYYCCCMYPIVILLCYCYCTCTSTILPRCLAVYHHRHHHYCPQQWMMVITSALRRASWSRQSCGGCTASPASTPSVSYCFGPGLDFKVAARIPSTMGISMCVFTITVLLFRCSCHGAISVTVVAVTIVTMLLLLLVTMTVVKGLLFFGVFYADVGLVYIIYSSLCLGHSLIPYRRKGHIDRLARPSGSRRVGHSYRGQWSELLSKQ